MRELGEAEICLKAKSRILQGCKKWTRSDTLKHEEGINIKSFKQVKNTKVGVITFINHQSNHWDVCWILNVVNIHYKTQTF